MSPKGQSTHSVYRPATYIHWLCGAHVGDGWMDGWVDGWVDGWTDGRIYMDGCIYVHKHSVCGDRELQKLMYRLVMCVCVCKWVAK